MDETSSNICSVTDETVLVSTSLVDDSVCSVTDSTLLVDTNKKESQGHLTPSEPRENHSDSNSPNSIDSDWKQDENSDVDSSSKNSEDKIENSNNEESGIEYEDEEGTCKKMVGEDAEEQENCHEDDNVSEKCEGQENRTKETDTFAYISEQLNFLNTESGVLSTHIHKSDEQVLEDKGKQGVKRPLDAESTSSLKKDKRQKLDKEKSKTDPPNSDDEWMDVSSSEDSSSEDGWRIIEESETEIDKKLEENAKKNCLSAANVKTILHHVITNEHVIAMVKNSLNEEIAKQEVMAVPFEPKMTRSKVKQVLEKEGTVPHPWPLSPLKRMKSPPPAFLDLTFSEEEEDDDDEYEPTKDTERTESDEDSESVVSSQVSEMNSPRPSTPTTPRSNRFSDVDQTPGDSSDTFCSPVMGPPAKPFTPKVRSSLGRKFHKAMAAEDSARSSEESDDQIIALRTRSRLPLTETSLNEIESNFVIPDITPDMYETECNDEEWQGFLTGLTAEKDTVDTADDEISDPEYNFLEAVDNEEFDDEDFRHDRAVRVSKKELNELMDELFEAYGELDTLNEDDKEMIKNEAYNSAISSAETISTNLTPAAVLPQLLPEQRIELDDQMRKHVQLLTQTYILAQGAQEYHSVSDISKHLLNELHRFSNVISSVPESTAYRSCNLEEAVNIVNEERDWTAKSPDLSPKRVTLTMKQLKKIGFDNIPMKSTAIFPCHFLSLTSTQMDVIWTSRVFMYPELLPRAGFLRSSHLKKEKRRIMFTNNEDNLIVLGLDQFKHMQKNLKWIKQLMMPCKTPEQIRVRIKNLAATKSADNHVKYFKKHNIAPTFPRPPVVFNENDILAPREQNSNLLPLWCKDYEERIRKLEDDIDCSATVPDRRRASSITLPVLGDPPTPSSLNTEYSAWSAPVSPATRIGDTTNTDISPLTQKKLKQLLKNQNRKKRLPSLPVRINQFKGFLHLGVSEATNQDAGPSRAPGSPITLRVLNKEDGSQTPPQAQQDTVAVEEKTDKQPVKCPVTKEVGVCTPVTCVLPTFIVIEPTITCTVTMSPTPKTKTVTDSPIMSSRTADEAYSTPRKSESILPLAPEPSCETYTPVLISPYKSVTQTDLAVTPQQKILETTPTKSSPGISEHAPVTPKALDFSPPKISKFSPLTEVSPSKKLTESPRRQYLQAKSKQARSLLSKGFVMNSRISPVKIAAYSLRNRARRQMYSKNPVKILPKPTPPAVQSKPTIPVSGGSENKKTEKDSAQRSSVLNKYGNAEFIDNTSDGDDDLDGQLVKGEGVKKKQGNLKKSSSDILRAESDDTQSETDDMGLSQYDSQNEEEVLDGQDKDEHLADLMAASTTISFTSKKNLCKDKGIKAKKRKELTLSMLAPDLVQSDPYRDERDTLLAQDYLNRVKNATKEDLDTYEQFLKILYEFGKGVQSPVKLYQDIRVTLQNYPELAEDFSGFLLPEQALECNCFMSNLNFIKARGFLRKIEIYFDRHPNHFQKVMRIFTKWSSKSDRTAKELRDLLEPMLKGHPHLLEELSCFFLEERPPESYRTDFEEVTLGDSDEESRREFDGFEEVELPDDDLYGTKKCRCFCHFSQADQLSFKRKRHCYNCSLKVIDGELYFRINNKTLKKVKAVYHKPVASSIPAETQTPTEPVNFQDDETAEKENMNVTHCSPHKNKSPSRPRISIKLCRSTINIPKKKKGKGRFYTLSEVTVTEQSKMKDETGDIVSITDTPRSGTSQIDCDEPEINTEPTSANHLELSAEELGIEVLKQDADTVVFQLKDQQGITNYNESENASQTVSQTLDSVQIKTNSEQMLQGNDSEITFGVCLGGTPELPNLCVMPPHSETVLNRGISRGNSEVHLDVLMENANTSPQKSNLNQFLGENSNFGFLVQENSNSDILEKAFKSALLGHGDNSVDSQSLMRLLSSPVKTSSPSKSERESTLACQNRSISVSTEIRKLSENSDRPGSIVKQTSSEMCSNNQIIAESSHASLNLSISSDEQNISCHQQNSDDNSSSTDARFKNVEKSPDVRANLHLLPQESGDQAVESGTVHVNSSESKVSCSGDRRVSDAEHDTGIAEKNTWKRECDREILETCKAYGSSLKTFEMISTKLGNKTPQQVAERFQTLMELLSEIETPSEDEDSLENSK